MKKFLSFALALIITFGGFTYETSAAVNDISGHWAQAQIELWLSNGYVSGYSDGSFKPNNPISRAEFFSVVNRAFNFSQNALINFSDVAYGDWYYDIISKAVGAGYLSLSSANAYPDRHITREEVAVIIANISNLTPYEAGALAFSDVELTWSRAYIGAVSNAGIMRGYDDGTFKPYSTISRAEAVTALNSALNRRMGLSVSYVPPKESSLAPIDITNNPINTATGTVTPIQPSSATPSYSDYRDFNVTITGSSYGSSRDTTATEGNVLIDVNNTTVRYLDVNGDLVLSPKAKGTVTLTDVYIKGTIYIYGSPRLVLENSEAAEIVVIGSSDDTKITLKKASDVSLVRLYTGAVLTESSLSGSYYGFEDVILESNLKNNTKTTLSGNFETVDIYATRQVFNLSSGTIVDLNIDEYAERGQYTISSGSVLEYVDINGRYSSFYGSGRIKTADINARNVTFRYAPDYTYGEYGYDYTSSSTDYDGDYRVEFYIQNKSRNPVEDAKISIYRGSSLVTSGYTDSDGYYSVYLYSDDYDIVISKSNYGEIRTSAYVDYDEEFTYTLGASAELNVKIVEEIDDGYKALAYVAVILLNDNESIIDTDFTLSAGKAEFTGVLEGSYYIYIEKDGYQSKKLSVSLDYGEDKEITIVMVKK